MKVPARQFVPRVRRRTLTVALLITVATLLDLSAAVGLAYLAGFSRVRAALGQFNPVWLAAFAGTIGVSFVGYHYAYRGVFTVEDGPNLTGRQMWAVVTAGVRRDLRARRGQARPVRAGWYSPGAPGRWPEPAS